MARSYLDFEIQIAGSAGGYTVNVIRSPAGEAEAPLNLAYSAAELGEILFAARDVVTRADGPRRRIDSPKEHAVQTFGAGLFNALIAESVRRCFDVSCAEADRQEKGPRLKLRIRPPALANLPWEFMYDSRADAFLSRSVNRPIVRYPEVAEAARPLTIPLMYALMVSGNRKAAYQARTRVSDVAMQARRRQPAVLSLDRVGKRLALGMALDACVTGMDVVEAGRIENVVAPFRFMVAR